MMGGLAYMTGPVGRPLRAGASVNDVMGGMFAAIAILAAYVERTATGRGQYVKSALFENCAFLMGQHMTEGFMTGKPVVPMPIASAHGRYTIRSGRATATWCSLAWSPTRNGKYSATRSGSSICSPIRN